MQLIKINLHLLLLLLAFNALATHILGVATAQQNSVEASTMASVANLTQVNFEQTLAAEITAEESSVKKLLLSRKRRYLLFPEGSSFQLVYDEIIGVVDYTNYLILGITVALAWELPSKPPSEQLEDLRTRLQDGTLGLTRNDTIENIKYIDTKPSIKTTGTSNKPAYLNLVQPQSVATHNGNSHNNYYAKKNLMSAFHAPMHHNYYYYKAPSKAGRPGSYQSNKDSTYMWPRRKDNYYYSNKKTHPFGKWSKTKNYAYTPAGAVLGASGRPAVEGSAKYPWWNLATRLSNSLRGKPRPATTTTSRTDNGSSNNTKTNNNNSKAAITTTTTGSKNQQQKQQPTGYYQSTAARKHRIFPVFGKRSVAVLKNSTSMSTSTAAEASHSTSASASASASYSKTTTAQQHAEEHHHHHHHQRQRRSGIAGPQLSKLDRLHIRHHRSTRQTLYERIEKYLDKRGSHGQHCVLRALCETGQKSSEHEPVSFVGELMRTIFTLPEELDRHDGNNLEQHQERVHYRHQRYDAAHAYDGDCAARYQHCKDSLWMSEFVA